MLHREGKSSLTPSSHHLIMTMLRKTIFTYCFDRFRCPVAAPPEPVTAPPEPLPPPTSRRPAGTELGAPETSRTTRLPRQKTRKHPPHAPLAENPPRAEHEISAHAAGTGTRCSNHWKSASRSRSRTTSIHRTSAKPTTRSTRMPPPTCASRSRPGAARPRRARRASAATSSCSAPPTARTAGRSCPCRIAGRSACPTAAGDRADPRADPAVARRRLPTRPRVDHRAARVGSGRASRHGLRRTRRARRRCRARLGRQRLPCRRPVAGHPVGDMMASLGGAMPVVAFTSTRPAGWTTPRRRCGCGSAQTACPGRSRGRSGASPRPPDRVDGGFEPVPLVRS